MKAKKYVNIGINYEKFERPAEIEAIRNEARSTLPPPEEEIEPGEEEELADNDLADDYNYDGNGAFCIRSGADWYNNAEPVEDVVRLFGDFWLQNEVCFFFADTNTGKSILAVQIANAISRGVAVSGFAMEAPAQPVIYFDFELTDQQFAQRYHDPKLGKYRFSPNFYRATPRTLSARQKKFATYEEFISNEIENALLACKAKIIVIDNISCLRFGTQNATGALNLMQYLQGIKRRYNASILVLAHTPKRNATRPLSRNDLQGSKMLINFADSAFAIGESTQGPAIRYLKQIKQRGTGQQYSATNVCAGTISKTGNFIRFSLSANTNEADHLTPLTEQYRRDIQESISQLSSQGQSIRQIAAHLGLSTTTVFRMQKKMSDTASAVSP